MRKVCACALVLALLAVPCRAMEARYVALTFDDGPSGALTERLLEGLAARDVKATFFVCGYRVEEYPELLQKIAEAGHEIGLHSRCHDYMQHMTEEEAENDLQRCGETVEQVCGVRARLFRPPGGLYGEALLQAAEEMELSVILWSVDPEDWDAKKTAMILPTIRREVFPGSVILMHDLHEASVEAALKAVEELQAQGYRFCTVSELAERAGEVLLPGKVYSSFRGVDESGESG